jgi:hypothetical protein
MTVSAIVIAFAAQLNALEAAVPGDEFEAILETVHIPTTHLTWAQYSALPWIVRRWCRQDEEGLEPFFREAVALANIDPAAGYDMVLDIEAMLADLRERYFDHGTYVALRAAREAALRAFTQDILRDPIDERAALRSAGRGKVARGEAKGTCVPAFSKALAARHSRRSGKRLERFLIAA